MKTNRRVRKNGGLAFFEEGADDETIFCNVLKNEIYQPLGADEKHAQRKSQRT